MTTIESVERCPTKLDELNRAFKCLYLACDASVVDDVKRRFDEYLAEQLAASTALVCGHPKVCEETNPFGHLDSTYRRLIGYGMFNEDQVDSLRHKVPYCIACERDMIFRKKVEGMAQAILEHGSEFCVGCKEAARALLTDMKG